MPIAIEMAHGDTIVAGELLNSVNQAVEEFLLMGRFNQMHQPLIHRTQQTTLTTGVKWLNLGDDAFTRSISVDLKTDVAMFGANKH